jgi:hypothetical protein
MSAPRVPAPQTGRPRGSLWAPAIRAQASDLLARVVGGEPPSVKPGLAGDLVVLCHLDHPVAAGTHRWDAEQALQAELDPESGMSAADHRQWLDTLLEVRVVVDGPRQAVRGVLASLGVCEGGIPVGPVAAGALSRRKLFAPREDAPLPWGLSADPTLCGPLDVGPAEPAELAP